MKRISWLLVTLWAGLAAWAQPIPVAQLAGPDGLVRDAHYGVEFTPPPGWAVKDGRRWGDLEATLFLEVTAVSDVNAAVYYHAYYEPFAPAGGFAAWLKSEAVRKAELRGRDNGYPDYANRDDSYASRTVGGHEALSWCAGFTQQGRAYVELLTHVVAPTGHALFFLKVPEEKLPDVRAGWEALVATARLTSPGVIETLPRGIRDGRRLHATKDYAKAVVAFAEGLKVEPVRTADLVAGAAAAARAGESDLALRWLQQAVAKDWTMASRLKHNADFDGLHESDGWKKLIAGFEARMRGMADTITDKPLAAKLQAIYEEDQKYRRQLGEVEKAFGRDSPEVRALWQTINEKDAENLAQVKGLLDERGWVGPETIGRQANSALFLVIQHADHATQVKYLPMMREAVKDGKALGSQLALLEDRVALAQGKRQIYGSQIGRDQASGKYYVQPLDEPEGVDERRASVGLQPIAEYVKHWEISWDAAAFKAEQEQRERKTASEK